MEEKIELIAQDDLKSPVTEAFQAIRLNLQFLEAKGEIKTIAFTSAVPKEGKSAVVSNLAVTVARNGKRVIILDCDFRNPTMYKILGLSSRGISDCLREGLDIRTAIQKTRTGNLELLAGGHNISDPLRLLDSKYMEHAISLLKEEYDYVFMDTPPVLPVADAVILANKADGVILIVAAGQLMPPMLKEVKTRLQKAEANLLGVILNKTDSRHSAYYDYAYGYYSNGGSR